MVKTLQDASAGHIFTRALCLVRLLKVVVCLNVSFGGCSKVGSPVRNQVESTSFLNLNGGVRWGRDGQNRLLRVISGLYGARVRFRGRFSTR